MPITQTREQIEAELRLHRITLAVEACMEKLYDMLEVSGEMTHAAAHLMGTLLGNNHYPEDYPMLLDAARSVALAAALKTHEIQFKDTPDVDADDA